MRSVLYLTDRNDPLTDTVLAAAEGRLQVNVSDDPASLGDSHNVDALLIGDVRLGRSLESVEGVRFVQLTRGHHRDVDVLALQRSGGAVAGSSPVLADYVAKHALGLACAAIEKSDAPGIVSRGDVEQALSRSSGRLRDLKLGIVGFGRVGQKVAEQARGLFKEAVFADVRTPQHSAASKFGVRRSTLDLLLSTCDVVSLHVQWGPASNHLLDRRELCLMSEDSVLVNTADARLVSESALAEALTAGGIRGAGLDVINEGFEGAESPLVTASDIVTTPYVGGRSDGADNDVAEFVVDNIERYLGGETPEGLIELIDFPRAGDPSFWSSEMAPRT